MEIIGYLEGVDWSRVYGGIGQKFLMPHRQQATKYETRLELAKNTASDENRVLIARRCPVRSGQLSHFARGASAKRLRSTKPLRGLEDGEACLARDDDPGLAQRELCPARGR